MRKYKHLTHRTTLAVVILLVGLSGNANNYYWVGGSGNWSDFSNHWATTSGGSTFHTQVPTSNDDVFFDANSFTAAGQIVNANNTVVFFRNMSWVGATNNPQFLQSTASSTINVFGSLTLIAGMNWNVSGSVIFLSNTTGNTITSAGKIFKNRVDFEGSGGGWTLQDAFTLDGSAGVSNSGLLNLNFGTLNTNGKNVTCIGFQSNNSNVRSLLMDNTSFVINNNGNVVAWNSGSGINFTLNATGSSIQIGGTYQFPSFNSSNKTFNQLSFTNSNTIQASIGGSNNIFNGNVTFAGISAGAGGNTFNGNLNFNNTGVLGGSTCNGTVTFSGDGQLTSNNTINGTLNFTAGKTYVINSNTTQTISAAGTFNATGSCVLPINIKSSTNGVQATISKVNGNLNVDQVVLQDIRAQLSPTFTANATNSFDAGNNTNWIFPPFSGANMYWIGGAGNWNDPNHWSFSSGGAAGTCIPGPGNNVFFDANSFTSVSKSVTVNVSTASCRNMSWTGAAFTPTFISSSTSNTLRVYGSMTLIAAMNLNYNGHLSFEAKTTGNTITSAGKIWPQNSTQSSVFFNGIGGGWSFQDAFNTSGIINLVNGSLNTNNQNVTCFYFESQNSNVRTLELGSSVWICNGYYWMVSNGTNLTLNAGTSTIRMLYCCFSYFYGGGKTYNNVSFENNSSGSQGSIQNSGTFNGTVTFLGDGNISSNNTFNGNLVLTPGKAYTFNSGSTQTISASGALVANGACTNYISIKSTTNGSPATINKVNGNLTVDNTILQDITAIVPAGYLATATNKSINAGGNSNWNFSSNTGASLYWVGGTGNWNDPSHWSLTSGGAPGTCVPGPLDDVYFDANSFTNASKIVIINVSNALCRNMNWTGAAFTPTLTSSVSGALRIYGSLTLINSMNFNYGSPIYFESKSASNTITTSGKVIPAQVNFNGPGGVWTLQDGLTTTNYLYHNNGTLNTNNQAVSCMNFNSNSGQSRALNLGSSVFTITNYYWDASSFNMSFNAGTSTIRILSPNFSYGFNGGGLTYNNVVVETGASNPFIQGNNIFNGNVIFNSSGTINGTNIFNGNVTFNDNGTITGSNSYNKILKFSPGKTYTLTSNVTQTFSNTGTLNAVGTPCAPIAIFSTVNGTYTNFSKASGEVCADYLYLTYARATGGAVFSAGINSTSTPASGTGWQFINCSGSLQSALITASGPLCGGGSITLSSRPATSYLWSTGATTQSIVVSSPGTYSLSIVNLNGCSESGSLTIQNSAPPTCSITGSVTACPATSETYSAPAGMSSYAWSVSGNGTIPGSAIGQTVSVTPTGCGTYILALTITNSGGCSSTCNTTVVVQDNVLPTISCPSNIVVTNAIGLCGRNVSFTVTASDNCGTPTIVSTPASGSFFPIGTTTVTSVATDACGNTNICTFTVTVTGGIDTDNDGMPDICDTDDDNDGVPDASDNCPLVANASQIDTDNDGLGNVCDPDDDNDGALDGDDNCPLVANANQSDHDGDNIGDICDPDDDNDGVPDTNDNCPLIANATQTDTDNDGLGNACDPDDDNDGVLDEEDCAPLSVTTPIVVSVAASNNATGPVVPQAMIFSGAGQNVTFVGQGPGHKITGGRTNIYSNINTNNYGGLWWTFTPIENPRHSSQGNSSTGQMVFNSYDPETGIITFTSTANMTWPSVGHTENISTRLRMQLQPYTGTHTGPIPAGLPFVTAGDISLGSLSANYPLIDIKAQGSTAAYQVWYIIETASGIPLDVYYGDPAHNSIVGGQTITSQTGSFFSSTLSTCNGGPATVTVTATGGTGPYTGTGVFTASLGEHTYTVTDANGCTGSATINIELPTPIVVTAVASNNSTGPVAPQAMIFSGPGQNVTFVGQGPGAKRTGGRTNIYSNINTNNYGGLWWTFTPIENPRHSSQGGSIGQMVFNNYNPATGIITFTSTANMVWPGVNGIENIGTRVRMQLQPYTGSHSGPIGSGWITPVTAGGISLASLPAGYPLIDIKALGTTAAYQVWYIIETAGGVALDDYYDNPLHNSTVGGITITSLTGSFFSSTLSTCNGGPATVIVTATGGTGPYTGTGVFTASLGEHTYTVTDANGCTGSATINVEAENCIELLCVENKIVSNDAGECVATVSDIDPIITPSNAIVNYRIEKDGVELESGLGSVSGKIFSSGVTTVTYTSVDEPTKSCSFTITVNDTEKPTVTKGSIGNCYSSVASAEAAALEATSYSDNCSSFEEMEVSVSTTGTCSAVITVTVTDAVGNSSSVTYNTRIDNTSPVLSVTPASTTVNCHQVPPVPTVTASDNCDGDVNVTFTPTSTKGSDPSQSSFYNYTITRKWFATDGCGNTVEHVQTITVQDVTAPTLDCPENITESNESGLCSAQVSFNAVSSDLCSTPSVKYYLSYETAEQQEITSPWTFAVGSYTVTVISTDPSGNSNNCSFAITVNDDEKPIVTKGSIASCYKTVAAAEAAALAATVYSDNCTPNAQLNVTVGTVGDCSAVITVTVTDAANNSHFVTYNTRIDNTSPVLSLTPPSTTVNCQSVPPVPTVTASDNCDGDVNVTFTPTSTKGSDPSQSSYYNYTITRKWFATDVCGNTVEHIQTITVQDVTPPTLTCPANIVVSNEPGLCSAQVSFNATSSDLCSTPTVKYYLYYGTPQQEEITSPRIFAVGSYTVKVISTDPSGNSNNCSFTITVNDDEKPVVTKGTIGNCYKTVAAAQAAALAATTYSDNCTLNAQLNVTVGTVGNCSAVITVTVTDAANNSHFVTYNTRIDNTSPVLSLTPASVTVNCQTVPPVPAVTANDNCDGNVNVTFTPTSTQGIDPAQSSYYNYTITRKWFATDGCGNTVEHVQVITVQDVTDPDITCPADKLNIPFDFGQLYATIPIGTATATDNCANSNITIAGIRSDNVAISNQQYPLGQTTVLWTATDPSDNSDECTQTITVRKRNTAATYTGDMIDNKICVQYSDIINLKAKLTDDEGLVTPNNISGRTITFQLLSGTTVLRSKPATTDANGIAVDTFKIEQAPGMYSVKTIFAGDAYFNGSYDQDNCEVKQEDAIVEYNGSQYFTTASSTTMVGSVTLAASVNDIDDGSDKRGDIRKAKATFRDGGPAGSVLGSANLPVGLVNPGILTNGISATTQNNITLNSNDASSGGKIFQVWIGTSDHYTGAEAGLTPVTLALPGQDFVTGGGHLVVTNSAGTYAGTLNSKMNFGFTMKWNKSGKNLQGNINIVFRKWQLYSGVWQWRVYQAKSNAINSMAVVEVGANGQPVSTTNPAAFRKAIINTKANLKDVTDPLNSIDLGGNHNLVLDAWDHITANGGVSDKISVTLMGATTNELLFSSSWSSNATAAQTITGGNINVRNGSGSSATTKTTTTKNAEMEIVENKTKDQFVVKAYPNPSEHQFTLTISSNLNEAVQIQIYDAAGRKLETINARANELIRIGEKLKTGIYFAQVSQGSKQETVKLIKQ